MRRKALSPAGLWSNLPANHMSHDHQSLIKAQTCNMTICGDDRRSLQHSLPGGHIQYVLLCVSKHVRSRISSMAMG